MTRFRTLLGLGLASSMMLAGSAFAATTPAATPATAAKPAAHAVAKPAAAAATPAKTVARKQTASPASHKRLVTAKMDGPVDLVARCVLREAPGCGDLLGDRQRRGARPGAGVRRGRRGGLPTRLARGGEPRSGVDSRLRPGVATRMDLEVKVGTC